MDKQRWLSQSIIKKTAKVLLLSCFVFFSILFINPPVIVLKAQTRSSSLQTSITEGKDTLRIDFLDEKGDITFAADVGYATKIIKKIDTGEIEEYYDERGAPVNCASGYFGLSRCYDKNGYNIITTYLDSTGSPMLGISGYSTVKRVYDDNGKIIKENYFDTEDNPVCTPLYGYGKINIYDRNGNIIKITYLNDNGNPMLTGMGYATLTRLLYSTDDYQNNKVEYEFYYDIAGNPIALSLGQYGVHKQYDLNGQNSIITFLDIAGNPMITTEGYTTIKRTYFPNNYVATERYYDINGEPYALSEGQYGIKRDNNLKTWYLNSNGEIQLNIKKLLYNHSYLVIVFVGIVVFLSVFFNKQLNTVLFVIYTTCIIYMALLFREKNTNNANIQLLWSYKQMFIDDKILSDIIRNIWMFIPLGTILYKISSHKSILFFPLILSVLIETTQYITNTGLCELDDIINNSVGSVIGYGIGCIGNRIYHQIMRKDRLE